MRVRQPCRHVRDLRLSHTHVHSRRRIQGRPDLDPQKEDADGQMGLWRRPSPRRDAHFVVVTCRVVTSGDTAGGGSANLRDAVDSHRERPAWRTTRSSAVHSREPAEGDASIGSAAAIEVLSVEDAPGRVCRPHVQASLQAARSHDHVEGRSTSSIRSTAPRSTSSTRPARALGGRLSITPTSAEAPAPVRAAWLAPYAASLTRLRST